mgnify:CR=1 FL=1
MLYLRRRQSISMVELVISCIKKEARGYVALGAGEQLTSPDGRGERHFEKQMAVELVIVMASGMEILVIGMGKNRYKVLSAIIREACSPSRFYREMAAELALSLNAECCFWAVIVQPFERGWMSIRQSIVSPYLLCSINEAS